MGEEATPVVYASIPMDETEKVKDDNNFTTERATDSPPTTENNNMGDEEEVEVDQSRVVGAGIVAGVVTLPFLGPVIALASGLGAAYCIKKPGVSCNKI